MSTKLIALRSRTVVSQATTPADVDKTQEQTTWLLPKFQNIPETLKKQPWAVWIAKPRQGKPGKFEKAPRNPGTGYLIAANKPECFGTFEEAERAYQLGGYTGIGVLLTGNGIVGLDIDDYKSVFAANSSVRNLIFGAVKNGIYCEQSPSGTGLRLFMHGQLDGSGRKYNNLEIYDTARFLTVTGHIAKISRAGGAD